MATPLSQIPTPKEPPAPTYEPAIGERVLINGQVLLHGEKAWFEATVIALKLAANKHDIELVKVTIDLDRRDIQLWADLETLRPL